MVRFRKEMGGLGAWGRGQAACMAGSFASGRGCRKSCARALVALLSLSERNVNFLVTKVLVAIWIA
jgi:hypothetical protein